MSDNNFKNSYDAQRELLTDTFTAIGQKVEMILSVGQLLMENGAASDRIVRVTKRVAAFMGIDEKKFHLHIMFSTLMLNISDENHSHTSFRKCVKHGVDMRIISAVSKLSWQALADHYTMEEFQGRLKVIAERPRFYTELQVILAIGVACGAYCMLFGGDIQAACYTSICSMLGKIVQNRCAKVGINPYVGMAFAAFTATVAAYFVHFLPTETQWQPIIACALFLVPGVPIINGLLDLLNTYIVSGAARFLHTGLIIGGMTFGIVFAIGMFPVVDFTNLRMLPEDNYLIFAVNAALGAMGFAILFNLPPRLLIAVGTGAALCVCIKNFLIFEFACSSPISTLAGSTVIGIIAVKAIHWLHTPMQVLIVPAVIPLVPGVLIYRFLFAMINIRTLTVEQLLSAVQSGVDAALIILAIAIGTATPQIFANRAFERHNKEKQERLLHEAYRSDLND
ncbi:MAG: threonine/serine exporter family protein [Selenomonadaceae bacterium]|nr:threonine/serine exporter family protein [Selenomonadaceae bacterium]